MATTSSARVLLIDDSPGDVRLMREAFRLAAEEVELTIAVDGEQALRRLHQEGDHAGVPRPDLVLLDLHLPGMSGREVLEEIKADPGLRRIPVIVLSASDARDDIDRSYDHHANCYVTKPLGFGMLLEMVRALHTFWLRMARLPSRDE